MKTVVVNYMYHSHRVNVRIYILDPYFFSQLHPDVNANTAVKQQPDTIGK